MKNNKIARKLAVYFAVALLVFSLLIGGVFFFLFQQHTVRITEQQLESRASSISLTIARYLEDTGAGQGGPPFPSRNRMNLEIYISNLSELAMADVWIVDSELNILTPRRGPAAGNDMHFSNLPPNAEQLIQNAFKGTTGASESFSSVLTANALTVGAPIITSDGTTVGVVLLHSPVSGTADAIRQGFTILSVSMVVALVLSFAIAMGFSYTFTRPLGLMKQAALKLAEGDYTAKTGIRQEDEIGELADILDELSVRLWEASKESEKLENIRREYVANISHELKTPITVIRGSLEALCDGIVTDEGMVKVYHEQMLTESKGLQRLVGDLLDLSRLQNADFSLEMTEVNLCEVLRDVERSFQNIAQAKGIVIRVSEPDVPCVVRGDYGRLRQLLMILADNAVKFSREGGTVEIALRNEQPFTLTVADHGIGISPAEAPHIFERFYKTRSPGNANGTGLGLAIAREIALRHQAELSAQSVLGEGSTFTLVFSVL